ncbi:hypothetical protein XENOCAPTIV_009798, partial [Xenoophorus captivus]
NKRWIFRSRSLRNFAAWFGPFLVDRGDGVMGLFLHTYNVGLVLLCQCKVLVLLDMLGSKQKRFPIKRSSEAQMLITGTAADRAGQCLLQEAENEERVKNTSRGFLLRLTPDSTFWNRNDPTIPLPPCSNVSDDSQCSVCLDQLVKMVCRNLTAGVKIFMEGPEGSINYNQTAFIIVTMEDDLDTVVELLLSILQFLLSEERQQGVVNI